MKPLTTLSSTVVVLAVDDIDTDQIIPARYLKGTDKAGLAAFLFADWRERPDFPLLAESAKGAQILLAGANFGCGSSREHAPWALVDWGFRAILAPSFADIFRQNATKNGLLPVALGVETCALIERAVRADPAVRLEVDLAAEEVRFARSSEGAGAGAPGPFAFTIDSFARHCLLNGLDELGYILSFSERITAHEHSTT
jgi:3-isopropylmalate/(R)-2-methylmalate dehydratase small subunit